MMSRSFTTHFPNDFDDYAEEIEAKGYFADLLIESEGVRYKPIFYDTVRFRQEYEDHLDRGAAAFAERNIVLVKAVTRASVEAAVDELARGGFRQLTPETSDE
jgi:hypothetical protein